jgi:hypothetical protein
MMAQPLGASTLLIALCVLAGFAAMAGLSSAAATLLFGISAVGLMAALGFGVVALCASFVAAFLAFSHRPA